MTSRSSHLRRDRYHDEPEELEDVEEDVQTMAAETRNVSPSSAIPVPGTTSLDDESDLERADDMASVLSARDREHGREQSSEQERPRSSWRHLASLSLSALSGEAAWRQAQADRNR